MKRIKTEAPKRRKTRGSQSHPTKKHRGTKKHSLGNVAGGMYQPDRFPVFPPRLWGGFGAAEFLVDTLDLAPWAFESKSLRFQ